MGSILYIAIIIFDVIVILDIFKSSLDSTKKILWTVAVIFFPVLGALIYWFAGRK